MSRTPPARNTNGAALVLRLTIGPMLAAHGYNKVAGPGGFAGTTGWFGALGFRPARTYARLAAATEMVAGAALALGLASPLPAAAAIGLMTAAAETEHKGKGFFIFNGGSEYCAVVAAVSAGMAMLGPGRYSVDHLRGRHRSGFRWGLLAGLGGVAAAVTLVAAGYRPEPPPGEQPDEG